MWRPTISSDELYHHGILGQKWGKRNGPPYPLSPGAHSSAEKKAGYKKSIGNYGSTKSVKGKNSNAVEKQDVKKPRFSEEEKKQKLERAKKNGLYDMEFLESGEDEGLSKAEALRAYKKWLDKQESYSGTSESGYGNSERMARIATNLLLSTVFPLRLLNVAEDVGGEIREAKAKAARRKYDKERMMAETDKKTGLKVQSPPPKSDVENLKRVNPDYEIDPAGARKNCTNCTMAMEMRERGFEVQAQLKSTGRNGTDFVKDMFPKAKNVVVQNFPDPIKNEDEFLKYMQKYEPKARIGRNKELSQKAITQLKAEPAGSRGQLLITWGYNGGHSIMYKINDKGEVNILDGQIGKLYNEKESEKLLRHTVAVQYQRLDNLNFNTKNIKEAVK